MNTFGTVFVGREPYGHINERFQIIPREKICIYILIKSNGNFYTWRDDEPLEQLKQFVGLTTYLGAEDFVGNSGNVRSRQLANAVIYKCFV